jgi:hypothetical protein
VVDAGAVTWGSGTSGVSGAVASSNSLVGTKAYDSVGSFGVTALSNGNYVVSSAIWDNAGVVDAGAVTWGSGTSGVSGAVTSSNSLVGTKANDTVGYDGSKTLVKALSNGNYVVASPQWDNTATMNAGAVTWGSGTSGVSGAVTSSNSLVGTTASDNVGNNGVTELSNGNYVVCSRNWDNAGVEDAGAVTWVSGTSGVSGAVTSSNSLVGTTIYDNVGSNVGSYGVTALSNGNYVVSSHYWDNAGVMNAGAVTWGSGTSGVSGAVTSSNSLVGITMDDQVGSGGVTALSNGNYVVNSANWDNAGVAAAGAVTWGSGTSGVKGAVTSSNSLVGSQTTDYVGNYGVTALSNGNYVVNSAQWINATMAAAGAVTWGSGTSGVKGAVSSSNSLVGITMDDQVGSGGVTELSNGNYVVASPNWGNAGVTSAGAVTWGSGSSGVKGAVTSSNSLVGTTEIDAVGNYGVTALTNGNYVVNSPSWSNAGVASAGAVTWGSGTSGVKGAVSSSNSLVGITMGDQVGLNEYGASGVTALSNGNYVVRSPNWANAGVVAAGAVTWGNGTIGVKGAVSSSHSLVGLTSGTGLQDVVLDAVNGTYFGRFLFEGSGKVRLGSQAAGLRPAMAQSLVFTPPAKLYLAENPFTLSATTNSGLPIVYTVISGAASLSGNVLTFTGTGAVKLRVSQPGNADFLAATALERTITVAADPTTLTLTLTNLSQTYTGTPRPITMLLAPGEESVSYKVGLNYVSEAPINVGSYPVKVVAGAITKTGTLVITKAPLFVQPENQRKFAGQLNPALEFIYSGFLGSDNAVNSVSKAPVIATTATATSAGGLYPITVSGGTSANYLFVYMKGTMKVETFAASYEALLVDADSLLPSAKLELTVTASSKTFTAKLTTPTETAVVALPGTLTTNTLTEIGTGTAAIKKGANTYLVSVTLPLTGDFSAEAKLNGTTIGMATDGRKLLTLATGQTLSYIGTHSALLAPATADEGVPAGAGWAVATIDAKGLLKLVGKLADGTTLTASLAADVSSNPGYRLFLQLYTPARTGAFIAGAFTLKPHPDVAGRRFVAFEDAADLTWVKAPRALDTSYRAGFGPVVTRFTLDPWLPPALAKVGVPAITLTNRLGLTAPQFSAKHSTISSASFADLPETLGLNATTNVVSVIAPVTTPANITKWKVTITPTTGAFVGSFVLTDAGKARTVPFAGMMRQPPSTDLSGLIGDGNFLLPSLLVAPNNEILSGEVGFER